MPATLYPIPYTPYPIPYIYPIPYTLPLNPAARDAEVISETKKEAGSSREAASN